MYKSVSKLPCNAGLGRRENPELYCMGTCLLYYACHFPLSCLCLERRSGILNPGLRFQLFLSSVVWMCEGRHLEVSAPIRPVGGQTG